MNNKAVAPKISTFIIALIIVSLSITALALLIANGQSKYSISSSINLSSYDKLEELNTRAETIQNNTAQVDTRSGIADIIGDFFVNSYQALLITKDSISTFNDIKDASLSEANLGQGARYVNLAITAIIIIIIFLSIFLSTLLKREV